MRQAKTILLSIPLISGLLLPALDALSAEQDEPPRPVLSADLAALAEAALSFAKSFQAAVWPAGAAAPDDLLLIVGAREFLATTIAPEGNGFRGLGQELAGQPAFYRARVFPPNLLATFPVVSAVPVIVVGTPDATGRTEIGWFFTISHEHFHQFVYSRPDYYAGVAALDLSGGDQSGMWMLNYPFPYEDAELQALYARAAQALLAAWQAVGTDDFGPAVEDYLAARQELKEHLQPADGRYMGFQLWQEGIARYMEYRAAVTASRAPGLVPALPAGMAEDFEKRAAAYAQELLERSLADLRDAEALATQKRVAFYALGHVEGLVLDEWTKGKAAWLDRYFEQPFETLPYFRPAN